LVARSTQARRCFRDRGIGTILAASLIALFLASESIAAAPNWSGTWETATSSLRFTLTLKQTGTAVTGHYDFCNGTIRGIDQAGTLVGTWHQSFPCLNATAGLGTMALKLSASGNSFSGTWAYATTPNSPVRWIGHRAAAPQPATVKLGSASVTTPLVFPAQAGKPFEVAVKAVTIAGTTRTVTPTAVTCQATIGSRALNGTGPGECTWRIPITARGKQLSLTLKVTYQGAEKTYHQALAIV
jgi:hypothetical protein